MPRLAGDSALQSAVLEGLSDAIHYRRWLADLARPHLGETPIEFGSGIGDYALIWGQGTRLFTATEADPERLVTLKERLGNDDRFAVRELALPTDQVGDHSAAVSLNVLEHIEDDVAALRSMVGLVQPGGLVIMLVPAFPSAMSRFDVSIGHFRRYTRASLGAALVAAGLEALELRYVNPLGLVNWYVSVKTLHMTPRNGALLRTYDRLAVPPSRWFERRFRSPFGQSVFAVARTPD